MNKIKLCALIPLLSLTACATGVSDDKKSFCLVLPQVKEYRQSDMDAVADEIEAGQGEKQTEMLKDYKVMRDQTRIAKEEFC